jgi:UDP-N-acetylmuramoyl-L-alanyl-D-glutamate--2,6-diaminopimelate ligase
MWQNTKNIYHLVRSFLANVYYGFPSKKLTVIGITGTSGKTTTTHMIYHVLKEAKHKVSLLSSVEAIIGGKSYDTGFHVTTPDPHTLPRYMRKAVNLGDKYFVLEVSSHGLDQNRAAFVKFRVGVLTTLAHEHLDYHKTLINYAKAKFKLLHQATTAVVPFQGLPTEVLEAVKYDKIGKKVKTFGLEHGDETQKKWQLMVGMPGEFNLKNAIAAAAVGSVLGIPKDKIRKALATFPGVPGRFEEIHSKHGFKIIVDFAHKPDAFEALLGTSRSIIRNKGRVIIMYGCPSERDTLKRPMMGEISARLADISVLTDEDPRREDPEKIIDEIAAGCKKAGAEEVKRSEDGTWDLDLSKKRKVFYKIPDRKAAIGFIITKLARRGDILLFCGKGHEKSMSYKGIEKPWNEHAVIKDALRLRTGQAQ